MEDLIEGIGIDEEKRLYLKPKNTTFPMIYREAMGVQWDGKHNYLYSEKPREWSYFEWYQQIIRATAEQHCKLTLSPNVAWVNIPNKLQAQIINEENINNT